MQKNAFPSLFPQWGSPIKVAGFFSKCRCVFTLGELHADCHTSQEKADFLEDWGTVTETCLTGRLRAQRSALGHGTSGGEPRPPDHLSSSARGRSHLLFLHAKM